mgnify:CR=1 FL=1
MLKNIAAKYTFRVAWSDEDQVYISSIAELPSARSHGKTAESALAEGKIVALESSNHHS